jgi:hypothetical protein
MFFFFFCLPGGEGLNFHWGHARSWNGGTIPITSQFYRGVDTPNDVPSKMGMFSLQRTRKTASEGAGTCSCVT